MPKKNTSLSESDEDDLFRLLKSLGDRPPVVSKVPENEWNFSKCPKPELPFCQMYEYGRESEATRAMVAEWHRSNFARADEPLKNNAELGKLKQMDFFRLFPEFPNTPWLDLPEAVRKSRLKSLPMRKPILVRSVATDRLKERGAYQDLVKVMEPYRTSTIQPLEVNWFFHDKELIEAFKQWLKESRPPTHRAQEKRGRTEPRVLLNALAAMRLLAKHQPLEAYEITVGVLPESLFGTHSDWLDAKRRAEDQIAGRLSPIGFEKLLKRLLSLRNMFSVVEQNRMIQYWAILKESEMRAWHRLSNDKFADRMRQQLKKFD